MVPLVRSTAPRVAGGVVFVVSAAVGFLPRFAGPGYEQSVVAGLLVPSAAAVAMAVDRTREPWGSPLEGLARAIAGGAVLASLAWLVAFVHAVRVGACDLWGGSVFFVLTAGIGSILGGAWGAVAAECARFFGGRRVLASVLVALAGPFAGIAVTVARFYATPMIFAYDPFFGYFSGALYDTVIDVGHELWTYRAGTAATISGLTLVAASLRRRPDGRIDAGSFRDDGRSLASFVAGAFLVAASLVENMYGPTLGYWQTDATIARALGGRLDGGRCDVVYPDALTSDQAALLLRDCLEEVGAVEARLGTPLGGPLVEYVFADSRQKRALMGAADTSIAKPWRKQVYVAIEPFPHRTLGHEIAHVVAGTFAPGPFHVGGGLWPNPGLIEGIAVATSPGDEDLTEAQWSRAMLDLGILPPVRTIFSLAFLGRNSATSYTVAGAFVAWVRDRWGAPVVRDWYGGGSIERLTGQSWDALDAAFRAALRVLPMPADAAAYARARFERPSVWERRCPHVVDALLDRADRCRDENRVTAALTLYDGALAHDGDDWRARYDRAVLQMREGDGAQGRSDLERVAGDARAPQTWRDRSIEALADDDLARGRSDEAVRGYRAVAERTLDDDAARALDVKILAAGDPAARQAVVDFLVGARGRPYDPWLGAASLGGWAEATRQPLAEYLFGKNLELHGSWERASVWLDRVLADESLPPRVRREIVRARLVAACAMGDRVSVGRVRRLIDAPSSPFDAGSEARRRWIVDLAERCGGP